MRIHHPPGRGGRLWLAERLEAANRAADLLEEKRRVLVREQSRLAVLERVSGREWEQSWRHSETWILRATVLRGTRVVSVGAAREAASVELTWRNSMGAYYPVEVSCRLPDTVFGTEETGTTAMTAATSAFRVALECAVQHAAAVRALTEVERELRATVRRSRVLRDQLIPAVTASLRRLDLELDERERDDVLYAQQAEKSTRSARSEAR